MASVCRQSFLVGVLSHIRTWSDGIALMTRGQVTEVKALPITEVTKKITGVCFQSHSALRTQASRDGCRTVCPIIPWRTYVFHERPQLRITPFDEDNSNLSIGKIRNSFSAYGSNHPFRSLNFACRQVYTWRMKWRGDATAATVLVSLCLAACNRSQGAQSGAAQVTAAIARPAANQQIQPQQVAQPSTPVRGPSSQPPTTAGKLIPSDRTQEFTVAQRKYRLLIHEQSIEGTTEKTVEWWELRDADDHVIYRQANPVTVQNGAFEETADIGGESFEGKGGSGIIISGSEEPSAPDSGGWIQVFAFKYGSDRYGTDPSLFVPFGPPVYVTGDFLGMKTDSYHPTPMFKGAPEETVTYDALKFSVWTGNFKIT